MESDWKATLTRKDLKRLLGEAFLAGVESEHDRQSGKGYRTGREYVEAKLRALFPTPKE